MQFVTGGGLRKDTIITQDGKLYSNLPGGNAVYSAAGANLWSDNVHIWARAGTNYPMSWLKQINVFGVGLSGIVMLGDEQDHLTFYAYTEDGRRVDTRPDIHFARIGLPLPAELSNYIHSTPGQEDAACFEPLALRPADWLEKFDGASVHLSPLALSTHLSVPPYLRSRQVKTITLDPGERYMNPRNVHAIGRLLPNIDAFLPSRQEVETLFGAKVELSQAMTRLCQMGAKVVIIKDGAAGAWIKQGEYGRLIHIPAYHRPGDIRILDVTGAGDAFCGGFLVGLTKTGSPVTAVQMGIVSASFAIEGFGAAHLFHHDRAEAYARLHQIQ